jgi:hypothetical protein
MSKMKIVEPAVGAALCGRPSVETQCGNLYGKSLLTWQ